MAEVIERVSVLEVQVKNLDEKIDEVKEGIKDVNLGLSKTGEDLKNQLQVMYDASCGQHSELAKNISVLDKKINDLEKFKNKWTYITIGGVGVVSWLLGHTQVIVKILGL